MVNRQPIKCKRTFASRRDYRNSVVSSGQDFSPQNRYVLNLLLLFLVPGATGLLFLLVGLKTRSESVLFVRHKP